MNELDIFRNYPLDTESYSYDNDSYTESQIFNLQGGNTDKPNGGFPPIYICEKGQTNVKKSEDNKTIREFTTHASTVSIKDILEKRRDIKPFI